MPVPTIAVYDWVVLVPIGRYKQLGSAGPSRIMDKQLGSAGPSWKASNRATPVPIGAEYDQVVLVLIGMVNPLTRSIKAHNLWAVRMNHITTLG